MERERARADAGASRQEIVAYNALSRALSLSPHTHIPARADAGASRQEIVAYNALQDRALAAALAPHHHYLYIDQYVNVHTSICTHVYEYVYVYVYICMCIYIHTHTHKNMTWGKSTGISWGAKASWSQGQV
jgi:hypothetical protein